MPTIAELEAAHTATQAATTAAFYRMREALREIGLAERTGQGDFEGLRVTYTRLKREYEAASEAEDAAWERLIDADKRLDGPQNAEAYDHSEAA